MKKNYVIDSIDREILKKQNDAGKKAREDVNDILADQFKVSYFISGNSSFGKLWNYLRLIFQIRFRSQNVVLQYPFDTKESLNKVSSRWLPKKCIVVIHDLVSLREGKGTSEIQAEIQFLNHFQTLITHNPKMSSWLRDQGCTAHMVELGIFDYLVEGKIEKETQRKEAIAFAGNLSPVKSQFLYDIPTLPLKLDAYGNGFVEDSQNPNLEYMGSFPPEKLPVSLNEKFGLVWDGVSINECAGNMGNYLRYNNPHKTSLYLVSGLPVIIWKQAALASFIEENQLGLTVTSLNDLPDVLAHLSAEQYDQMVKNTLAISARLQEGYYLKHAIEKCLED